MMINKLYMKLSALNLAGQIAGTEENAYYTIYKVLFADSVTYNKVKARTKDLEIFFGGRSVEIETEGSLYLIKVRKPETPVIASADFFQDITTDSAGGELPVMIGQNENGQRVFCDLAKAPHILIGGATGSGKSVYMHNCITSLLYGAKAGLCLIDVKRVEFSIYKNVSALCCPIATDTKQAKNLLINLCNEMDKRYMELERVGCRTIREYIAKGHKMQYVVLVIDELADLLCQNRKLEQYIVRLCQLGRAAGIHLIVATQRPDSDILSGLIRSNIPTRICFAVQKATDSRIVLDMAGGEKLAGCGDGLYKPIGANKPERFKTPYISTECLEKIAKQFNR